MSIWIAVLFGIVQGLTEFLPVSSSAHLSVLFNLFGVTGTCNVKMFSVFAHLGSFGSIVYIYWNEFAEILYQYTEYKAGLRVEGARSSFPQLRLVIMMMFTCIPLLLILPINSYINLLFGSTMFIGVAIILSGLALLTADHMTNGTKTERSMSISDAIIIGLAMCVSAIPGVSRTGILMTAGLAVGLKKDLAVKYAVLVSAPVILVSNLVRIGDAVSSPFMFSELPACLTGAVAAFFAGVSALRILSGLANKDRFGPYAYYSWIAGVLFIILTMIF